MIFLRSGLQPTKLFKNNKGGEKTKKKAAKVPKRGLHANHDSKRIGIK
jgi:hypothetical protein